MTEHPSLEDLTLFVYGNLPNPGEIEQHIDECPDCAAEVLLGREMRYMDSLGLIARSQLGNSAGQHDGKESKEIREADATRQPISAANIRESRGWRGLLGPSHRTIRPRLNMWMKMAAAAAVLLLITETGVFIWQHLELRELLAERTRLAENDTRKIAKLEMRDENRQIAKLEVREAERRAEERRAQNDTSLELKRLRAENERFRLAQRAQSGGVESPLQYVARHAPRPAKWDMLLDNSYVPGVSAEENLARLTKVVDSGVQAEIARMQAEKQPANQILQTLFSAYGPPKKR